MKIPALLVITAALLLVGFLVYLQFRYGRPPAGTQLLTDLWKHFGQERRRDNTANPDPAQEEESPRIIPG